MTAMAHLKVLLLFLWIGFTGSTVLDLHKRIHNGQPCQRQYHVQINSDGSFCGGSLIHAQWVLTSAHCLKPGRDIYAVLGIHPGEGEKVEITAGSIFVDDKLHDIMLLKLTKPSSIDPVALPTLDDCKNPLPIGKEVEVAGHGDYMKDPKTGKKINYLKELQCAKMDVADCKDIKYLKCFGNTPHENKMCYSKSNTHTCPGDSGGGVIYNNKIYGVHKGGTCGCAGPDFSVKVCPYIHWITKKIDPKSNGK